MSMAHVQARVGQRVVVVAPLALLQCIEDKRTLLRFSVMSDLLVWRLLLLDEVRQLCGRTVVFVECSVLYVVCIAHVWRLYSLLKERHARVTFGLVVLVRTLNYHLCTFFLSEAEMLIFVPGFLHDLSASALASWSGYV